jgi:uncharacterized protein YndB with AHSA1/START domain
MSETQQDVVLQLSRRYDAPRERVFDAWTSPEVLKDWWAAQPTWHGEIAEVDLRPGGAYRLGMKDPESGTVHIVAGEYKEVNRPEKLAFTWAWEGHPLEPDGSSVTLVEIDFVQDGDATEVTLTHSGFASEEISESHSHGWNGCLDSLGRYLSTERRDAAAGRAAASPRAGLRPMTEA